MASASHFVAGAGRLHTDSNGQAVLNIQQATLMEPDQKTPEISTEELRKTLGEKSATVFDARPFNEYAVSHIPGAVNVSAKPGVSISLYVSDIAEIGGLSRTTKRPRWCSTAMVRFVVKANVWRRNC